MYVISLTYTGDLEKVDSLLEAHIAFLKKHYQSGCFLASGRKVPRTGGIILARAENRENIERILKEDPFWQNNVAEYAITEFAPSMTCTELDFLKE